MKLTRAKFAERCGVSEQALSKAVRNGSAVEDGHGKIDTTDATNRAYMKADHQAMKHPKKRVISETDPRRGARSTEIAALHRQKLVEQIRNLAARTAKDDVERARKLDLYTERRMVETAFAAFGVEWKSQILDLPKRIMPTIYEMCQGGKPVQEAILYADKAVAEATRALKEKGRSVNLGDLTA